MKSKLRYCLLALLLASCVPGAHAQTPDGQTPLHLHIYTMEPELATALRAQQGSWAGKNDLELKSFHNEYAGVDYANDQSVNGIIQVNWNQVVTGTPESMGRKIRPLMVLDGLVTRLVLFPMPENDFMMIDRRWSLRTTTWSLPVSSATGASWRRCACSATWSWRHRNARRASSCHVSVVIRLVMRMPPCLRTSSLKTL